MIVRHCLCWMSMDWTSNQTLRQMWPSRGYFKFIIEYRQKIIDYQVEIKRVAAPYGNCMNNWTDTGINEAAPTMTTPENTSHMLPYTQGVGMK